ncbi:MAG: ATP-binding protein [Bacteroidetes bacterium]|nr:ATP-binding protein [Bacteroidota bacterium]
MIIRKIKDSILSTSDKIPVVSVTGPRQSGKTTLTKQVFHDYQYVNLEDPRHREFVLNDPAGFLNVYNSKCIFDEVQQVPDLFSYIQVSVDETGKNGQFVLSGSQNFLLLEKISQSLAGRVAIFRLLPFSIEELIDSEYIGSSFEDHVFKGGYPRIYDQGLDPTQWLSDYIQTYVERDMRTLLKIGDLDRFQFFMRLLAGRNGQLLNLSDLGMQLGVNYHTIQSWISVLEASFIVFKVLPYHGNYNKRLVKTPKLYFYDSGLACALMGIRSKEELQLHYAKGPLFESFIVSEIVKYFANRGISPHLFFWRDSSGHEIDCLIETGSKLIPIEIKAGMTLHSDFFKGLTYFDQLSKTKSSDSILVYGGDEVQHRKEGIVTSWKSLHTVLDEVIR